PPAGRALRQPGPAGVRDGRPPARVLPGQGRDRRPGHPPARARADDLRPRHGARSRSPGLVRPRRGPEPGRRVGAAAGREDCVSGLRAALAKDALLQWRTRVRIAAVFVFGAATLMIFSFAVGPAAVQLRAHAAGFLWLGLLLSSTLSLAESFGGEMEHRALEGLLLLPASPRALY